MRHIPRSAVSLAFAKVMFFLLFVPQLTRAAGNNTTWTGGGGNDDWGTSGNWSGGITPSGGGDDIINFAGTTRLTPNNNYGAYTQYQSIFFNSGAGSFTLNGNAVKLYGKIQNDSSSLQTVNFGAVVLNNGTATEINPVSGDLRIQSGVVLDTPQLRVFGNNGKTVTFDGAIANGSATGSVAINQNSVVVYNAANTYTGGTFVNAGQLRFGTGSASGTLTLGDTSGTTGAAIAIGSTTGGTTVGNVIAVRSGSTGTKTLLGLNTSGTNTFSGVITINTGTGAGLSVSSAGGTGILDLSNQVLSGTSGTGVVLTAAGGTVNLSGTADNQDVGVVVNSGSTLNLNKTSSSSAHAFGVSSTVNSGGTLKITGTGGDQIFNSAGLTVDGNFDLNAQSETIGGLTGASTGIITNTATGTSTLTVGSNSGGGTYSGALQDGGSGKLLAIVKLSSGNQTLSGANTYTGGTTWGDATASGNSSAAGVISFGSSSVGGPGSITSGPLGTGTFTVRNSGTSTNNYLQSSNSGTRTISNAIAFAGSGVLFNTGGTGDLIFDGAVALGTGSRTFTINNTNTTFSGVISNSADINKAGTGTMILSGSNTGYTGTTNVNAGILNIRNSNALGATSAGTNVAAAASLQLQGGISVGAEALSLTGNTGSPFNGTDLTGALRNISGTNSYGGAITFASQAAIGSDAGLLTLSSTINNAGFRMIFLGAGDITASNSISGAGDLLKQDSGTLTVAGNNSFGTATNAVFFDKGTIKVGTGGTLGNTNGTSTGWVNMGASVAGRNGDTNLLIVNSGVTVANAIDVRNFATDVPGNATVGGLNGSGTATFSGTLALHDNVFLSAASGGTVAFTGEIQNGSLSGLNNQTTGQSLVGGVGGGVTLNGAGTVILSNGNSYAGGTTVSSGTLLVNNAGGSATGTGTVVTSGGTLLGGTGSISGATTVVGNLNAGNGGSNTETLAFGSSLNLSGAQTTTFDLTTTTRATGYDGIDVTGLLTYGGALNMNVTSSFLAVGQVFDLFAIGAGGQGGNFTSAIISGSYSATLTNSGGIWSGTDGSFNYSFSQSSGDFSITAVPEPATIFGALSLVGLLGYRERKRIFAGLQSVLNGVI